MNGLSDRRKDRAPVPVPIMMSIFLSSIALYSTSSTALGRRCISSMKKTSRASQSVSNAAKSPALVMIGPELARKGAFISFAMTCANVVFPNPGGPQSSR